MFYILDSSKHPLFALMAALHTVHIILTSFMNDSPGMVFSAQVCLDEH